MFVDDLAEACIKFMNIDKKDIINQFPKYKSHINVGSGNEITIKELSKLISRITNFEGKSFFENNQLEGVNRKILNSDMIHKIGWKAKTNLIDGLKITYEDFLKN